MFIVLILFLKLYFWWFVKSLVVAGGLKNH